MTKTVLSSTLVAASLAALTAAPAFAEDKSGYWTTTRGEIWRSGYDLCWRAGYWTPALAIAECDPDLVAKPEPAPAPAPAPAPEPAPVGPAAPAFEKFTFSAETLFAFDKATIRPDAASILDDVVAKMKRYPEVELIVVTGHTDRIGSDAYNQRLSDRRAAAVRDYLVNQGVESSRITAEGRGESQPVVACDGIKGKENRSNKALIDCLQPNRRVVIEIAVQREVE